MQSEALCFCAVVSRNQHVVVVARSLELEPGCRKALRDRARPVALMNDQLAEGHRYRQRTEVGIAVFRFETGALELVGLASGIAVDAPITL